MAAKKEKALEQPKANGMLIDVDGFPKKKGEAIIFAIQHVLAMFVACITVPLIIFGGKTILIGGDSVSLLNLLLPPTLVAAGIGTIFYLIMTKFKSPMFLASSFAYLAPMGEAVALVANPGEVNLWILPIGMAMVGVVYCIVALLIKLFGVKWLNKLLPPIVVGPVIMVIGLSLAGSAINNLVSASGVDAVAAGNGSYNLISILCGVIAMVGTALSAHYGKKLVSLIPFVIGMGAGYVAAVLFTCIGWYGCGNAYFQVIDFSPLINNFTNITVESFVTYPRFLFLLGGSESVVGLTWEAVGKAALLFIPVSFVTICEHIGDHKNMSGILGRDLLTEPGLSRTLIGDGVATALSGVICGAANTTYGENVAVVGVTKVASTKVILMASIFAIALGFISPVMSLVSTIPACVTGGVSLILYGFIASSGVKMLISEHIDMSKTRNIFISSVILVAGIGGLALNFFGVVSITSTAVSMILGIIMNLILKEKKEDTVAAK